MFIGHLCMFFEEMSIHVFACFKLVVLFLLKCNSFLYLLDTRPQEIDDANIFSSILCFFFTFLIVNSLKNFFKIKFAFNLHYSEYFFFQH